MARNGLREPRLDESHDVGEACRAVVERLAMEEGLLPSVYLARGGRLRCEALSGYWQARDGMPPTTGVVGRAFTTGREIVVQDVAEHAGYLEALPGVTAEVSVPLRTGRLVVGVLNVESREPLSHHALGLIRRCAADLGARIAELGGPPAESEAQRLLRHVAGLAALEDVAEIERAVLQAALDLVDLDSAMLVRAAGDADWHVRCATGPLADVLRGASQAALRTIAEWLQGGASCFTVGRPHDEGPEALAPMREGGVGALAALTLAAPGERGMLVLAGSEPAALATDRLELLELLSAHAASVLRTTEALESLRERAATDPLTGLGHHATFHEALASSHRRPRTAVLVCDIDGFKKLNDTFGHQHGDEILRRTAVALGSALRRGDRLFRIGGDEFAALLAVDDDAEALEAGGRLRAAVRAADLGLTVSIGVAVPREGESDAVVLGRADRALYRVKAAGRDGVALADDGPPSRTGDAAPA
jgi:diguanylate cyclase (GGDEF)-like protein